MSEEISQATTDLILDEVFRQLKAKVADLTASLAQSQAEIERLRGVIEYTRAKLHNGKSDDAYRILVEALSTPSGEKV